MNAILDLPTTSKEIRLASRPAGEPTPADFELASRRIDEPADGEIVVRNSWMSVDPSARIRMDEAASDYLPSFDLGEPLSGWAVGEVVASAAARFAVGDQVLHPHGWRDYSLLDAGLEPPLGPEPILVDSSTPAKAYVGPLGWVGLTSWVGLLDVAELRAEDVVFISGAAGAVGSLAVQIAKLRGHFVIASAGSPAKVSYVRDELGADVVFSYRDGPVCEQLPALVPDGIDLYFDNVGGEHLEAALTSLRPHGRVALCGAISTYNDAEKPAGPRNLFEATAKGLTLRGFLARMYAHRMEDFRLEMRTALTDSIVYPETVFEGLERAPEALIGQLRGENVGKVLVSLG
jgi:NADPH-dependent curcumin reductase CurA